MPVTTHTVIDPAEATDIESLGDTLTGAGDGTGDAPGVMFDAIRDTAGATTDVKSAVDGNGTLASHLRLIGFETDRIGDRTDNIPALGQALEAASVPCVLTAAQETALKAVVEASAANSLTALQLIDNTVGTHDDTVSTAILAVGSKAETTTPAAVADGNDVRIWTDEYGAVVIKGFDTATGTLSIREQDPAILRTIEDVLLNAVTANSTSDAVTIEGYKNWGVEWLTTGTTTATISLQVKRTSSSTWMAYATLATLAGADEHDDLAVSDHVYAVRVVVTGYTGGTISVYMRAGV